MDPMEPFLAHLDEIWRLALSRCGNPTDADDLTQETFLRALVALRNGKKILYPRTWLANTLMHLWNDRLRQRYRYATVVMQEPAELPVYELPDEAETALLRTRVASLTRLYREVITLHYIGGLSVAELAERLGVPEGTVKRRLHDGREKLKKEKKSMEIKELANCTPMRVSISWTGTYPGDGLIHLAHTNLMGQILATAYEKPLAAEELARIIGVPVYYFEDQLEQAVELELMVRTPGDKYYTNAFLRDPGKIPAHWQATRDYVSDNLAIFADSMNRMESAVAELKTAESRNPRQQRKLQRFAFIEMLQHMMLLFSHADMELPIHKSGRAWLLIGKRIPLGMTGPADVDILAGHRTSGGTHAGESFQLHEFDTTLWDNPNRYIYNDWLFTMGKLIYAIHRRLDPLELQIPAEMVEALPRFTEFGIFAKREGGLSVDLPILNGQEYEALQSLCLAEAQELGAAIGGSLTAFMETHAPKIPAHLGEVAHFWRRPEALTHLIPAVYRTLYDRGLYLQDVDYCCPPAVFVLG